MPSARTIAPTLFLAAGLGFASACKSAEELRRESQAEQEARVAAQVEARLRQLFPEVAGPLTRAAIAATVLGQAGDAPGAGAARLRAIEALQRGDDEAARLCLAELRGAIEGEEARRRAAAGDAAGALAAWDRALALAPESGALRLGRAEARLAAAKAQASGAAPGAQGSQALALGALEDFRAAAERLRSPEASFGAARAALAAGELAAACGHAREGWALAEPDGANLAALPEPAERTRADALWAAWSAGDPAERDGLAEELRAALEAWLGREPERPEAWVRLAALHDASGRHARARTASLTGLALAPAAAGLYEALERSTRALGGPDALVATFELMLERDPLDAEAAWRLASEHWRRGIEQRRLLGESAGESVGALGGELGGALRAAREGFARAGRADLAHGDTGRADTGRAGAARAAEARALVALAGIDVARGALAAARAALAEAEALEPSALAAPPGAGFASGIELLEGLAVAWSALGGETGRADAAECAAQAAACHADLERLAPAGGRHAAARAALLRSAALAFEARARTRAGRGELEAARADVRRARELMEQAYAAASAVARAAPEDPALARAPGTILVHFLERDVPQAEAWLKQAARLWEREVEARRERAASPGLALGERAAAARALEDAEAELGDTWQDLGVLQLVLKGDPYGARAWFERALGVGRDPREDVRGPGGWLARCDEALARGADARPPARARWGEFAGSADGARTDRAN